VTQLRQKMLEELQRRNYSHRTAKTYVRIVREFATYFHQPPDKLGPEQIRQYQAHLFQAKKFGTRKTNDWREQERKLEAELSSLRVQVPAENALTVKRIFELANKAHFLYLTRNSTDRGQLLKSVLLNCDTDGVSFAPTYRKPFDLIFERAKNEDWSGRADLNCGPVRLSGGSRY
jgi:hypothetical protein